MGGKKILLMILLILVLVLSIVSGVAWNLRHYVLVDFQLYPRDAQQLDLQDQQISIRHYKKLHRRLPACEIQWKVPFQGASLPWDTREVTISALTEEDAQALAYLEDLQTVHAENCTDYESLLSLQNQRPDLQVEYRVLLGDTHYDSEADQVELKTVSPEDISRLPYLPNLKRVLCSGGEATEISRLRIHCQENSIEFLISLGGETVPEEAQTVTAEAITEKQIGLLQFLPELKQLHIRQPEVPVQTLLELKQSRPDITITWERRVCGKVCFSTDTELDLSGAPISSLEELHREMAYFPDVKQVFLGECSLPNEALAAQRDLVRSQYKLVWTVSCGSKLKARTDDLTFMPVREHVYYFNDEEAYNLRYCEDMVCIDIGHMNIHNIDFVEFMPNLEYLILAHTQLQYIEPLRSCKKLRFLELDWSPLKDLSPLKDCTALEDLNLGNTFADFTPIEEMTWLKNLWMVDCSTRARYQMTQALPNTKVMVTGAATVANGWRELDNYYQMRDLLGMQYMSW